MSEHAPAVGASVVVPVGVVDNALTRQLRALTLQESAPHFEIVLSRNTADHDAARRLDRLVGEFGDDRVRIVVATDHVGAAYARNVGAQCARGETLAFCDADDVAHPAWLARLSAALGHYDAVGGRLIDRGLSKQLQQARPPTTPDKLPSFLGVPYIPTCSLATRRTVYEAVGGFDETLVRCEDIAFGWVASTKGFTLGFAKDALLDYYHRPGVLPMLRQHYWYGKGMSQVLKRYGLPQADGWSSPTGIGLLRPNSQPGEPGQHRSVAWHLRRASLGAGRFVGLVQERTYRRRQNLKIR